jgi:hypothetical protein
MPLLMILSRSFILAILMAVFSVPAFAKRPAPEPVPDVIYGSSRYSVVHFAVIDGAVINGGYVEAHDDNSGQKLWSVIVYRTRYRADLERDVQDIFITSMVMDAEGKHLIVTNEANQVYRIELVSQKVQNVTAGN